MSNLGPLTTTYTPPSPCLSSLQYAYVTEPQVATIQGPVTTGGCFPENYDDTRENYYSPGICPVGYVPACTSYNSNTQGKATETVITCCPTSFDCNNFPTWSWEFTMGCSSAVIGTETITVTVLENGAPIRTYVNSVAEAGALNAYSYQIRFQSTDFQTSTSPPSTSIAPPPPPPASPTPTLSSPPPTTTLPTSTLLTTKLPTTSQVSQSSIIQSSIIPQSTSTPTTNPLSTASPATTLPTTTSPNTAFPTTTSPPTITSPNTTSPSAQIQTASKNSGGGAGLSAGKAAGIGVGASLGVILLVGAIILTFILGRRSARRKEEAGTEIYRGSGTLSEMQGDKPGWVPPFHHRMSEVPGDKPGWVPSPHHHMSELSSTPRSVHSYPQM